MNSVESSKSRKYYFKYLHYVFKVAISNSRIIKLEDHKVFFKYKKSKSNRWPTPLCQDICRNF
ncbi:MAG: transposase [Spirochaetes bacterium]|nr:transposase [Spirochaetota bacterium]